MAKLTKAQQKKLDELLAIQEKEEYEPPEEVAFEIGGAKVWIPYAEAKRFLKKEGIDLDEVLEETDEEEGDEEEEEETDEEEESEDEPESESDELPRIPRKKVAKKAAPPIDERTRSQRYFRKSS